MTATNSMAFHAFSHRFQLDDTGLSVEFASLAAKRQWDSEESLERTRDFVWALSITSSSEAPDKGRHRSACR